MAEQLQDGKLQLGRDSPSVLVPRCTEPGDVKGGKGAPPIKQGLDGPGGVPVRVAHPGNPSAPVFGGNIFLVIFNMIPARFMKSGSSAAYTMRPSRETATGPYASRSGADRSTGPPHGIEMRERPSIVCTHARRSDAARSFPSGAGVLEADARS